VLVLVRGAWFGHQYITSTDEGYVLFSHLWRAIDRASTGLPSAAA
jgi:hypothetical protein